MTETQVPPNSIDAEQYIIGACMFHESAFPEVGSRLTPKHFYHHRNARIFAAIFDLGNNQKPIDLLTVTQKVRDNGGEPGDALYLADCLQSIAGLHSLEHQIDRVIDKAALRNIVLAASRITEICYSPDIEAADAVREAETHMFEALQSRSQVEHKKEEAIDVAEDYLQYVQKIRSGEIPPGSSTGFTAVDFYFLMRRQQMVVLAGRPGMGKSAFALTIGIKLATQESKKVAIFSLEMSAEELMCRLLSFQTGIPGNKIRNGDLTDAEMNNLIQAKDALESANLFIDDTPYTSVAQIVNRCRYLQHKYGLDLIIVDYLQLLGSSKKNSDAGRTEVVTEITRSLKMAAKILGAPVMALSQLSRNCEARNNKRPILADLRESGSIEQDADIVVFVYRDQYYNPETTDRGVAEIIVAKNRSGDCGTAVLGFRDSTTEFYSINR